MKKELKPVVRIVEDEPRVRQSESFVLRLDGWDVMEYESAETFLERDDLERPGCIVLDIRLGGMSGLELQAELLRRGSTLPILFLTGHGDVDAAVLGLKRGAADFVKKPMSPEKLQKAVKKLVGWHVRLQREKREKTRIEALFETLTAREKEVVRLVARGLLNKQIAEEFGSSEQTVKIQRASAFRKLGVRNAVEASEWLGVLDAPVDTAFPLKAMSEDEDGGL